VRSGLSCTSGTFKMRWKFSVMIAMRSSVLFLIFAKSFFFAALNGARAACMDSAANAVGRLATPAAAAALNRNSRRLIA
jgi:hypothetical protein